MATGEMPAKKADARDCNLLLDELAAMLSCAAVRKVPELHKAAEDLTCTQANQADSSPTIAKEPLPTVVVTTGNDRDPQSEPRAKALISALLQHGKLAPIFVTRYHTSARPATLTSLMTQHDAIAVVVVDGSGTHLRMRDAKHDFRLHGGFGVFRVKNVLRGCSDNLTSACALREGDVFVDCTAGQLQDALVAAAAVGPTGRVIALEASPLLWSVSSGRPVCTGDEDIDRLLNERIEVRLGEAAELCRHADCMLIASLIRCGWVRRPSCCERCRPAPPTWCTSTRCSLGQSKPTEASRRFDRSRTTRPSRRRRSRRRGAWRGDSSW